MDIYEAVGQFRLSVMDRYNPSSPSWPFRFRIGDRVFLSRNVDSACLPIEGRSDGWGQQGTVIGYRRHSIEDYNSTSVAVAWDTYMAEAHCYVEHREPSDIFGDIPCPPGHGWWVDEECLDLVVPKVVTCPKCEREVEVDILGLCPECTWNLKEAQDEP